MTLQFIHDNRGNTTGVFIPIEEWQHLKTKYADLQNEEAQNSIELPKWQKDILDIRLADLNNPDKLEPIDELFKVLDAE